MAVPVEDPARHRDEAPPEHAESDPGADLNERMAKLGAEQMLMTPQEFDAYIRKEIGANAALVKAAGITVN